MSHLHAFTFKSYMHQAFWWFLLSFFNTTDLARYWLKIFTFSALLYLGFV